jgi:hypothetical protein
VPQAMLPQDHAEHAGFHVYLAPGGSLPLTLLLKLSTGSSSSSTVVPPRSNCKTRCFRSPRMGYYHRFLDRTLDSHFEAIDPFQLPIPFLLNYPNQVTKA